MVAKAKRGKYARITVLVSVGIAVSAAADALYWLVQRLDLSNAATWFRIVLGLTTPSSDSFYDLRHLWMPWLVLAPYADSRSGLSMGRRIRSTSG
jgi:hypothetical protein